MPRDDAATRRGRRAQIRKYHETGLSNRAIGRLLGLDHKTVAFYLGEKVAEKTPPVAGEITTPFSTPGEDPNNVIQLRREAL